jgi:4-carboxymuconolactone decarboxylase
MAQFNMAAMDKMWPTVPAEMLEAFWGKQFNPEGLDAKTRLLLTLQGLTIQGAVAEAQIRLTVRHAIEAGATKQEVAEAIGMAAMFGGVPAMNKAMDLAKDAIEARRKAEDDGRGFHLLPLRDFGRGGRALDRSRRATRCIRSCG